MDSLKCHRSTGNKKRLRYNTLIGLFLCFQRFGSDGSLMGLDNPAFQDISYSIEEKGSNSFHDKSPKKNRKPPNADELIRLIQFEPPVDR